MGSWPPQQADMAQWQVAIQEQVLLRVVLMVSAGPGYRMRDDLKPGSHATRCISTLTGQRGDEFALVFFCIREFSGCRTLSVLWSFNSLNHLRVCL